MQKRKQTQVWESTFENQGPLLGRKKIIYIYRKIILNKEKKNNIYIYRKIILNRKTAENLYN